MIAVIFEFTAVPDRRQEYLAVRRWRNRDYGRERRAETPRDSVQVHG